MKRKLSLIIMVVFLLNIMPTSVFSEVFGVITEVRAEENETLTMENVKKLQLINEKEVKDSVSVTSADITPPTIDISSLKVDKKEAKPGDSVNISIKATDDMSGIKYIWIYYRTPITGKSEWVKLYYNERANRYEGSIYIDENKESGLWEIGWIYAEDNLENTITIYNSNINSYEDIKEDLSAGNFKVNGTQADITPPSVDISSLKVDRREVKLGDSVNVSIKASDDMSGIKYIWIYYRMPITGKSELVKLYYNESANRYEGSIYIDENKESGLWEIGWIYAEDNLENTITIYNSNINSYANIKEDLSSGNFNVETDDNTIKPIDGVTVVTKNEYLSNKTINGDLYIGPEAVLTMSNDVRVTGNVYVLGALKINGGVYVDGTLYGTSISWGGNPTLYNGTIVMRGSNSIASTNISNYPVKDIPIRIDTKPLVLNNGKLDIKGATLNIVDMYIEDQKVTLDYSGRFDVSDIYVGNKTSITIKFKTVFGNTIVKKINLDNAVKEDVNKDGVVDTLDLSLVGLSYNTTSDDENFNVDIDINKDGIVDIFDLVLISKKM